MVNTDPARREDVMDPMGRTGWPSAKRRDGERTPMQWEATPAAGFTTGRPWLPVPASARSHNVATQRRDPGSVLNWHRALLALRRSRKALLDGAYRPLAPDDPHVLAYLRVVDEEAILVAVNLSGKERRLDLGLGPRGQVLLATGRAPAKGLPATLGPYCALVATLGRPAADH